MMGSCQKDTEASLKEVPLINLSTKTIMIFPMNTEYSVPEAEVQADCRVYFYILEYEML